MNDLVISRMTLDEALAWKSRVGGTANQLRVLLSDGYERGAWEVLGYTTWTECVRALAEEYGFTERRLWQLHAANQTEKLLNPGSVGELPEKHLRPLTTLEPEQQREAWQRAVETAPNGKVTAAHVQSVVSEMIDDDDDEPEYIPEPTHTFVVLDEWGTQETIRIEDDEELTVVKKPHVANNSGNNEWYTPAEYIEAARKVMGRIDLDPASSAIANKTVKATIFYTVDDDGLAQYWEGNVWMNPPYAGDLIGQFVAKLVYHVQQYDVREAIVLVNNATETAWFQELITEASAVVFPRGRIKYLRPNGLPDAVGLQGQAFVYIGQNESAFLAEFARFGWGATIE